MTPNSLQRDLTREIYLKKRVVSDVFTSSGRSSGGQGNVQVLSYEEVPACLPLGRVIWMRLDGYDSVDSFGELEEQVREGGRIEESFALLRGPV